jgi:hypothetical protein
MFEAIIIAAPSDDDAARIAAALRSHSRTRSREQTRHPGRSLMNGSSLC